MTHILKILNNLAVQILKDKENLNLFAFAKLSESDQWNLLAAADWCKSPSTDAFKYLYATFDSECQKYKNNDNKNDVDVDIKILEFPFVILSEGAVLVKGLKKLYRGKPIHVAPVAINVNTSQSIEEIYLFGTDLSVDRDEFEFLEYGRVGIQKLAV